MMEWIHDHSLTLFIVGILVAQTTYFGFVSYDVWYLDQRTTGIEYWKWASHEYNLSVVADVWGALFLIHGTKIFREKGSPESGDDGDEV